MRTGFVSPNLAQVKWGQWISMMEVADHVGLDVVLLRPGNGLDPLLLASAISSRTQRLQVVVEIEASRSQHPLHLAERIAVADQCLGGRLHVALRMSGELGAYESLVETLDIVTQAMTSRPFRYRGALWRVPAGLEANDVDEDELITITPSPAQISAPLWLSGTKLSDLAGERGAIWLRSERDAGARYTANETLVPCVYDRGLENRESMDALIERLISDSIERGINCAFLPCHDVASIRTLVRQVRPRIQLAALPPGLSEFWDEAMK